MTFSLNETIRPIDVNSENGSAGIAYITIPDSKDLDRDQFIEDCYRSHTVVLQGGLNHGMFYDVGIDKEVIKSIIFPKEKGKIGSPVVWVNIPPFNKPIIIAVLKGNDEYEINAEGEWNVSREFNGNHIDINAKAKEGVLNFSVISTGGKVSFNIIDANKKGEFKIYVKGKTQIHATEEVQIVSDKKIQFAVVDEDSKNRVVLTYEREKGFSYIDEFDNEINLKGGQLQLKSDKINHNDGTEPMVLGNTLKDIASDLCDALTKLTVICATPGSASGPPVNIAEFIAIKARLETILSKKSNLD